jgi:hypothetical protein
MTDAGRKERLERIRTENGAYDTAYPPKDDDISFLLAELTRVEADRDEWKGTGLVWRDERDTARARAERLAGALRRIDWLVKDQSYKAPEQGLLEDFMQQVAALAADAEGGT